jgi:hypothetical protein
MPECLSGIRQANALFVLLVDVCEHGEDAYGVG